MTELSSQNVVQIAYLKVSFDVYIANPCNVTTVKQYDPDLSMRGHKNCSVAKLHSFILRVKGAKN